MKLCLGRFPEVLTWSDRGTSLPGSTIRTWTTSSRGLPGVWPAARGRGARKASGAASATARRSERHRPSGRRRPVGREGRQLARAPTATDRTVLCIYAPPRLREQMPSLAEARGLAQIGRRASRATWTVVAFPPNDTSPERNRLRGGQPGCPGSHRLRPRNAPVPLPPPPIPVCGGPVGFLWRLAQRLRFRQSEVRCLRLYRARAATTARVGGLLPSAGYVGVRNRTAVCAAAMLSSTV